MLFYYYRKVVEVVEAHHKGVVVATTASLDSEAVLYETTLTQSHFYELQNTHLLLEFLYP